MTPKMTLQVHPLKVLATREVIMKRMDYSTYLTGTTKDELDRLNKLEGRYKIQSSKLTIEAIYNGKRLPSDDWEYFKECFEAKLPINVVEFIEDLDGFRIFESKSGPRTWIVSEESENLWRELLTQKGDLTEVSVTNFSNCRCLRHDDHFIEDGKLVSSTNWYLMYYGKIRTVINIRDSITTDKLGNVVWTFMWSEPTMNVKFTKVMWAFRVYEGQT